MNFLQIIEKYGIFSLSDECCQRAVHSSELPSLNPACRTRAATEMTSQNFRLEVGGVGSSARTGLRRIWPNNREKFRIFQKRAAWRSENHQKCETFCTSSRTSAPRLTGNFAAFSREFISHIRERYARKSPEVSILQPDAPPIHKRSLGRRASRAKGSDDPLSNAGHQGQETVRPYLRR